MDAVTEKYERDQLYISNETAVIKLQSAIRGFLVRRSMHERLQHYEQNIDKIIKIQVSYILSSICFSNWNNIFTDTKMYTKAWWRMLMVKNSFENRVRFFQKNTKSIVYIQSMVRMWIQRKKYISRLIYLHSNVIFLLIKV
jgi:hypothetical protein